MLSSVFADVGTTDTRFIIYAPTESDIPAWFETHNVSVTHRPLGDHGPDPFLTIESGGSPVGTLTLAQLESLLTPPIERLGTRENVSEGYRVLFEVLDRAVFTALDRAQLLSVSRESEDRAYRVAEGRLQVCFQTLSTFRSQVPVYRHLAADTDLAIDIYARADWDPPAIEGITYHDIGGTDLDLYWLLAFDSGSAAGDACGLFAREERDTYTGYWTDDRGIIERIGAELQSVVDDPAAPAD